MTSLLIIAAAGEMVEVTLREPGASVRVEFTLESPAYVEAIAYFPPTELGSVGFEFQRADGTPVAYAWPEVWPAGDYAAIVRAGGASETPFPVRIAATDPLDPFEPNDTREQAAEVTAPLRARVRLQAGNEDWYRIRVPRAGILSVQVRPDAPSVTLNYTVSRPDGTVAYTTAEWFHHRGARYVGVEAGDYSLQLFDHGQTDSFATMSMGLYSPPASEGRAGGLMAVGVSPDSADWNQLTLLGRAAGHPLRETFTVEEIERELARVVAGPAETASSARARRARGGAWGFMLLALVIGAGAVAWMVRTTRRPA